MMNPFRSILLVFTGFLCFASGQAQVVLTKAEIRNDVLFLLQEYQQKIALIKPGVRPDPVREFTALFANQYVMVVNNLSKNPTSEQSTIREYAENLKSLYPTGVNVAYNPVSVRFGLVEQDFGDQYAVTVRFYLTLSAFPGGTVFENRKLVEFRIVFRWDGEAASNFRIAEVALPEFRKSQLGLSFAGGGARFTAPWMENDTRSAQLPSWSGSGSVNFTYWITPVFGLGTGLGASYISSHFTLDRFNQFAGHDPNISDIHFRYDFYLIDLPIYGAYGIKLSDRLTWLSHAGVRIAYRSWSTGYTSGMQTLLGKELNGVISYPDYQDDVAQWLVSGMFRTGFEWSVSRKLSAFAGVEAVHGLSGFDVSKDESFQMNRFTGQYHPLWMDPETRNYNQFVGLALGIRYMFENQEK